MIGVDSTCISLIYGIRVVNFIRFVCCGAGGADLDSDGGDAIQAETGTS